MAILAGSAAAQATRPREHTFDASTTLANDLRRARIHYGPFYLLSSLELSDLGYQEQYFAPTHDQGSGFTLAASAPQKLYFVPSRKNYYSVTVTPEYGLFRHSGRTNQFGYSARGDAHVVLNHNYWNLYGLTADHLRADPGEINRVVTEREKAAGLNGEFRYSSRTGIVYTASAKRFTYPLTRYQPADITIDLAQLDHSEQNYRAMFRHQTFPLTALTLAGEWNNYSFTNAPQKNADRRYVAPGFMWDNGRATLRVEAGPARLNFKDAGQRDFKGVLGNAAWTHRVGTRGDLNLFADRDIFFSAYTGNNYYVGDRAALAYEVRTPRQRLSLRFTSSFGRDKYDLLTISPFTGNLVFRRDDFWWNAIGWRYTTPRFRGGFDVGYYDRHSTTNIDDQHGIRVAVQLSLTP